jgi:acetyltransferase-like isoleucine patch superfamily enzyme
MSIILKIKRRENKFYDFLYRAAKQILRFNFPVIKTIHLPLYYLSTWVKISVNYSIHIFWSIPLFKSRCEKVGKGLQLPDGIPLVAGHLKLFIGDNVTIMRTTIGASKIFDEPKLIIGNNSTIGYGTVISVAKEITIGDNCSIGPHCIIMDSDDHPISPQKRLMQMGVEEKDVRPVFIGNNVWIGAYSAVLRGVTIGDNSIIGTHSVVTRDVPENCIALGFPARPTIRDIHLIEENREESIPKSRDVEK